MLRTISCRSESKRCCMICHRNGHEDEACAAQPVTFTWKNGGNTVFLSGSFNQWQVKTPLTKDVTTGHFRLEMGLAPGLYQYKFLVDDEWVYDRDLPSLKDKEGKLNNTIEVQPADFGHGQSDADDDDVEKDDYLICIEGAAQTDNCQDRAQVMQNLKKNYRVKRVTYDSPALWVSIKGSWDDWKQEIILKRYRNNFTGVYEFYVMLKILPGKYQFKFLVDGDWVTSEKFPTVKTQKGHENNILVVPGSCEATLSCPKIGEKACLNWRREDAKWNEECGLIHHTLQGHTMSVICDKVYIFGGLANGRFTNSMYTYDPKTKVFELVDDQGGDLPDPRAFHNAMVFGTKILIYGGFNQEYLADYYSFNTLNNQWSQAEVDGDCPCPRERASMVPYVEDKVILFGGYYGSPDMEVEEYFNDLYVLNLSLMEFIKPAIEGDIPKPRSAHTANFVHGKMYMFGGITKKNKNLNDMWVLKATPTAPLHWKKLEPKGVIPEPRHGHSSVVVDNNIIFFGGRGNGTKHPLDDLFVFDTNNEQWNYPKAGGIKPTPRYYHGSVSINGGSEIMIFGGVRPKEFLSYPRVYTLEVKAEGEIEAIEEEPDRTD